MYLDNSHVRLVTVNEDGSVEILFKDQTFMDIPKERVEIKGKSKKPPKENRPHGEYHKG